MYSRNMNMDICWLKYIHRHKAKKVESSEAKRIGGIQELTIYSENMRSEEMLSRDDGRIYFE